MKRILVITPFDMNVRTGGGLAGLAYYNSLCSLFPGMVDTICPKEACYGNFASAIAAPKRTGLRRLSLSPHRYKSFVHTFLTSHKSEYGLCVINGGIYAGDMMDMIHRHGLKIMVIHHNCEREFHMDNKTPLTLRGRTPFYVNHLEKAAYKKADRNCFLTSADIDLFRKYYGTSRTEPYLLGVFEPENRPGTSFPDRSLEDYHPLVVAITGSLSTLQTRIGIKDFFDNYYRILKEVVPEVSVLMAGRDPGEDILSLERDYEGISVIPNPVNMDDVLKDADVFLCPTNVGGGLKLRVMDGLKKGLPVLTHQVSARGYEFLYEFPFFRYYSDADSFKKGIESILLSRKSFTHADIRAEYLKVFSFSSGESRMKDAVKHLVDQ